MRIIHFVPYYPPERVGGVGEFVAGLHRGLSEVGHTSLVVTSGVESQPDVRRIARRPLIWFLKTTLWAREAAQYDVVHCQSGEAMPVILALALRRKRPRILTTFHVSAKGIAASFKPYTIEGRTFARGLRPLIYRTVISWLRRLIDRVVIRLSDAVNAISLQSARDVLGKQSADESLVVYYGLDELPLGAEDGPSKRMDILYVGVAGHRKRVVALPWVLAYVRRRIPEARMRIVGFVPESEPEVMGLFEELDLLPWVDFVGVKTSTELPPYYASAGVLVVPSAYEGLPFVILEAMRSGLPVVTTRVSGHPEVIEDGENGFMVDVDRPELLAERCIEILSDSGLRSKMAQRARQTIRDRFGVNRQLQEYLGIYERLITEAESS